MIFICLVLPACFALGIQYSRNGGKMLSDSIFMEFLRLGRWIFLINIFTMFIVIYLLRVNGVLQETFLSLGFASKYMMIAFVVSVSLPYVQEILKQYISIEFKIDSTKENENV